MPGTFSLIQKIVVFALPVLFAITLHEAAHGYVARYFGDKTAEAAGRITLNPLRHIDLMGTIIVPILSLALAGIMFGWAKPVPVNFSRLRKPREQMLWVAAAGPFSNLAMALAWALVLRLGMTLPPDSGATTWTVAVGASGILVNAIFFVLNLLPLPPLDGGRVMASLLPPRAALQFSRIEPFGLMILIVLMATGFLGKLIWYPIQMVITAVCAVFGISPVWVISLIMAF